MSLRLLLWSIIQLLGLDSLLKSRCGAANIRIPASHVLCDPAQEARAHDTGHGGRQRLDKVRHELEEGGTVAVEDTGGGDAILEATRGSVLCNLPLVQGGYESIMRTADKHLACKMSNIYKIRESTTSAKVPVTAEHCTGWVYLIVQSHRVTALSGGI